MLKNLVSKRGTVIATLVALALASFSVTSAFAAGPTKSPATTDSTQAVTQSLEANWKAELSRFQFDSGLLARAERIQDDFSSRKAANRERKEVNANEPKQIVNANALLVKAQSIISKHTGFDGTGKVSDQKTAAVSMEQLGGLLSRFHGMLDALRGLLRS